MASFYTLELYTDLDTDQESCNESLVLSRVWDKP